MIICGTRTYITHETKELSSFTHSLARRKKKTRSREGEKMEPVDGRCELHWVPGDKNKKMILRYEPYVPRCERTIK
jgi:hypothetical protein